MNSKYFNNKQASAQQRRVRNRDQVLMRYQCVFNEF